MESTFLAVSERGYRLSTLGGREIYFVKKKDGTLASLDEAWVGTLGTMEKVELKSPDGWSFIYRNGRLSEAEFKDLHLRWNYQKNLFTSLSESRQGTLVSVEYGAEGLPVRISTPGETLKCEVQKVPVVANTGVAVVVSGFEYSLAGLSSESWTWKFPITLNPEGNYSLALSNASQLLNTYLWRADTGILISEGGSTYTVSPKEEGDPLVSRKNSSGGVESYFFDNKTGVSEQSLPDGSRVIRSYFVGLGPTQYKLRKCVRSLKGKDIGTFQRSYDEKGRLIREVEGSVQRMWSYSPEGQLLSMEESRSGELRNRMTYDKQGRLSTSVRPGCELRYSYEAGQQVVQRLESGKVMAVQVLNPSGGIPPTFFTKSGTDELESRGVNPSERTPQELENSKNIALRAIANLKNEILQ